MDAFISQGFQSSGSGSSLDITAVMIKSSASAAGTTRIPLPVTFKYINFITYGRGILVGPMYNSIGDKIYDVGDRITFRDSNYSTGADLTINNSYLTLRSLGEPVTIEVFALLFG